MRRLGALQAQRCAMTSCGFALLRPSPLAGCTVAARFQSGGSQPTTTGGAVSASGVGGDVQRDVDTHPDFQPRIVSSSSVDTSYDEIEGIKKDIRDTIKEEDVVLFMKGLPEAPVCGFSKKLVDVLEALGLEYTSFDVLAHPVVRTYVKELSDWPTIPQLFVKGEFAGGVDICLKMAESGDLQLLLDKHGIKHRDKV